MRPSADGIYSPDQENFNPKSRRNRLPGSVYVRISLRIKAAFLRSRATLAFSASFPKLCFTTGYIGFFAIAVRWQLFSVAAFPADRSI
ncbi:hypothetical protein [Hymenobacter koreensis]|uniref:hypothetical protein n=1 Tax=Hymenobacter koreensis TaxID=1084523 RepID=UPI0031EAB1D4